MNDVVGKLEEVSRYVSGTYHFILLIWPIRKWQVKHLRAFSFVNNY